VEEFSMTRSFVVPVAFTLPSKVTKFAPFRFIVPVVLLLVMDNPETDGYTITLFEELTPMMEGTVRGKVSTVET
jgi:hypothetical protein